MTRSSKQHYSSIYAVWESAGWNQKYRLTEADFIQSWDAALVKHYVMQADQIVAIGRAHSDGVLYAMIYDVVVLPEFRGCGFGRRIVERLIADLKDMGIRSIQLMAAPDQAPFYEKLGFRIRAEQAPGMEYVLDQSCITNKK